MKKSNSLFVSRRDSTPVPVPVLPFAPTLVDNGTRPLGAVDLGGGADSETLAVISKEGSLGTTVAAEVKVDVGAVLVGARETVLGAQWVAVGGTQVVDHDHDAGAGVGESVAGRVGQSDEFPARTAGGASSGTRTDAVQVLTDSGAEARVGVEGTRCRVGVAVGGTEGIAGTIVSHGRLEGKTACGGRSRAGRCRCGADTDTGCRTDRLYDWGRRSRSFLGSSRSCFRGSSARQCQAFDRR